LERPLVSRPRSTVLLANGTLRPDHFSEKTTETTMCHPRLEPLPYLVMLMHLRFSSPEQREGGEGNTDDEEEDDEDSIEIFPILDSTSRPVPRHIAWIQVGAQWRPTGTLAPRYGAREPEGGGSPMTGSTVWRPPPPQDGVTTNSILREIKYFQTLTQRT
jgi:hypothetical protein